jgi:hypothetical protein
MVAYLCVFILAGICASCSNLYTRNGVGTDLYWSGLPEATRLQEVYVQHICQQAGLANGAACSPDAFDSRSWTIFVQAGMNDIDARCDSYLTWLDANRRSREPVLQQLSDMRTATTAILSATGSGVTPIAIVAASFGLATSSFTNFNSRLIFDLDQSTVQTVVLSRQNEFRQSLPRAIDNKAAAIYALRSYLRLCMPMTIETQVNTTIKLYESGGTRALQSANPMIDAGLVKSPVIRDARAPIAPPQRRVIVNDEVRQGPYEKGLSAFEIKQFQSLVCRPEDGKFTKPTREAILKHLRDKTIKDASAPDIITANDGTRLRDELDSEPKCN